MPTNHWDNRFMEVARTIAQWSKDRSRKIGCVIVGPGKEIRATGYNGFPRGVNDNVEARHQRPAKYRWTEHAERNAIYNASRSGVSTSGCTAYLPWFPCMDCARALIQAGIAELVAVEPDWNDVQFGVDFKEAVVLLREAGVGVRYVPGEPPERQEASPCDRAMSQLQTWLVNHYPGTFDVSTAENVAAALIALTHEEPLEGETYTTPILLKP
jgi:dCMP deaminase